MRREGGECVEGKGEGERKGNGARWNEEGGGEWVEGKGEGEQGMRRKVRG